MRLALVTTSPARPSGIGDHTRALAAALRADGVEVLPYVPDADADAGYDGLEARPVSSLSARAADRILYPVGNERGQAHLVPLVRELGGTVLLHDWVLFDLMTAVYPALERGGLGGHRAAWSCGGLVQRARWAQARRGAAGAPAGVSGAGGRLLHGWHAPEPGGRWTARRAGLAAPEATTSLTLELTLPAGRSARLVEQGTTIAEASAPADGAFTLTARPAGRELILEVDRATRAADDPRELGAFVRSLVWDLDGTQGALDLAAPAALPTHAPVLSDARFDLSFHRPIVRFADGFVVHSRELARRIEEDRRAPTPILLVPHGVDGDGATGDRAAARERLGWSRGGATVVSFGAIQDHKRPGPLLAGVARALAAGADLHLVLAGAPGTEQLDLQAEVERLGLTEHVTVTGFLDEAQMADWLRAADVAVNLRGPSTGGTSGGVARALAAGRATILSDLPEWAEFPDEALARVPLGADEVEVLAAALSDLARDAARRERMEAAALAWAREVADWPRVAGAVHRFLADGPAHRTVRKSLLKTVLEGEERRRAERAAAEAGGAEGAGGSASTGPGA